MSITNLPWFFCRIRGRRGFTLIEGLIAAVILAFSVVSVSAMLSAAHQQSDLLESSTRAANLARGVLEEIQARPFEPPNALSNGFASGNSDRSAYDDLADYQGYTTTVQVPVPGTDGKTDPYGVAVAIEYRDAPDGVAVVSGDFALVTVTVTDPSGQAWSLQHLAVNVPLSR